MTVPGATPYPEQSQATTILVLGIVGGVVNFVGLLCCGILAPVGLALGIVAWVMGRKELAAITNGLRNPSGESSARAGMIVGIIATVLGSLVIILWVFVFGVAWTGGIARS